MQLPHLGCMHASMTMYDTDPLCSLPILEQYQLPPTGSGSNLGTWVSVLTSTS
jgi:hypothetical protein